MVSENEDDEWFPAKPKSAPTVPLYTVAYIYELSRVDAIINLQRWWKYRRRHNHKRIVELRKQLRAYADTLVQKKRQARIRAKIRDILLHILFLYVYTVSIHRGYSHERLYQSVSATTRAFQQGGAFKTIASPQDLYAWMRADFLETTYPSASQNVQLTNHVIGGVRIGQLRVNRQVCTKRATQYFSDAAVDDTSTTQDILCYGSAQGDYDTIEESVDPIGDRDTTIPFAGMNGTDTTDERSETFSTITSSTSHTYPAPAYSVVLPRANATHALEIISTLEALQYVDFHTRVVMIDINLYNAMLQYVLAIRFLIEFPSSGGANPSIQATVAPLTKSFLISTDETWWTICNLGVLAFYLYFLLSEIALQGSRRRRRLNATGRALRWSRRNGSAPRMLSLVRVSVADEAVHAAQDAVIVPAVPIQ